MKNKYTVRIEWPVTYYCDTTVRATSPEEAAGIAMEDPDYDSQDSYDDSGNSYVAGVSEGEEFDSMSDYDNGVPLPLGAPVEVNADDASRLLSLIKKAAKLLPPSEAALAKTLLNHAKKTISA